MVSRQVTISSDTGMHARPAAMFVKLASRFPCEIFVKKDEYTINGKSIMGLMMLALSHGTRITIEAHGEKEEEAVNSLADLVEKQFSREDIL